MYRAVDCIGYDLGLLVYLFEHKMLPAALFSRLCVPCYLHGLH